MSWRNVKLVVGFMLVLGVAACGRSQPVGQNEYADPRDHDPKGSLSGSDGTIFSNSKGSSQQDQGGALGVNAYLWRGALDTLSFMPLSSADPFGGVIITDWFQPPAAQGERFKATAYILGRQLRADGVKVSIFRQVMQNGQWVDAPVSPATATEIENKILVRARELRTSS
ncbi:MAG: hypothetical protein ABS99_08680 [Acetobacteraceae bacterium SCN 69-10]|nr:MAG: hypothetical protein ABS99_08680 [Acetobacteraceae bacterium SCN 69-10]OJY65887.1 MAG: hypothetical protein BGP12_17390 [Rhodospirillales bacterium 70-18]